MRVGFRDLTVWSFLMASAHGAGLMVLPVLLGSSTVEAADHMAGHNHASAAASPLAGCSLRGPYDRLPCGHRTDRVGGLSKVGLALLRKAWFNLNLAWAIALVVTSVVTLVM